MISLNLRDYTPFSGRRYEYILAANGLFLAKENEVFRAIIRVEPAELELLPLEERLELKRVRLPFALVQTAVAFLREVYRRHNTEGFLWILMDPRTGQLSLSCPQQVNSPAHVHAETPEDVGDLLQVGDIHSHPCSAFHSGGDEEDEIHSDGVHVVVGHLDAPAPQFMASLAVRGRRRRLDPKSVMELEAGFDTSWLTRIKVA